MLAEWDSNRCLSRLLRGGCLLKLLDSSWLQVLAEDIPNSMAQIPVPVPISRTLLTVEGTGANCRLPLSISRRR